MLFPPFLICPYSPWWLWEEDVIFPTYIWLTMASHKNSKLTGALRNAPQKIPLSSLALIKTRLLPRFGKTPHL